MPKVASGKGFACCSHRPENHFDGRCRIKTCRCSGPRMPQKGERLVFGTHRMSEYEATQATAWPALKPDPKSL